jgi:hypothetical protein
MKACFKSFNSLGDALYTTPVLCEFHRQHPYDDITIWTELNWVTPVYSHMGFPVKVVHEIIGECYGYTDLSASKAAEKCDIEGKVGHIAEVMARTVGIKIDSPKPIFIAEPEPFPLPSELKDCILVSPFSYSCITQHGLARKMLRWVAWDLIIRYLRSWHLPIRVLGAPEDRCPLAVSEDEYMTGVPLNRLANIMRQARLLVTVDNGVGHLAASQGCPEFLFYPKALRLDFLLPKFHKDLFFLHVDPERLDMVEVMCALRRNIPNLIRRRGERNMETGV